MLIKPRNEQPLMKLVNFYMPPELIGQLDAALGTCQEIEQIKITRADIIRDCLRRGLASIQADIEAHKVAA
jgi:hypothetical protein